MCNSAAMIQVSKEALRDFDLEKEKKENDKERARLDHRLL